MAELPKCARCGEVLPRLVWGYAICQLCVAKIHQLAQQLHGVEGLSSLKVEVEAWFAYHEAQLIVNGAG